MGGEDCDFRLEVRHRLGVPLEARQRVAEVVVHVRHLHGPLLKRLPGLQEVRDRGSVLTLAVQQCPFDEGREGQ